MHVVTITIDHTKVAGDLTNYIVLVVPNSDAAWVGLYAAATEGGGDIRIFKDDDTTELAREIVSFSVSGETGEIHIKYSGTLSSSVDTDIHIYADGTSADYAVTDTYGRNAVWSAYRAVYHLNDLLDSTGNGYTLTNNNTVTLNATGKLGGAADFTSGNTNKTLAVASDLSISTTAYTIDMWVNKYSVTAYGQGPWIINASTNRRYYGYFENSGGQSMRFAHEGTSNTQFNVSTAWTNSTWHKITQKFDNTSYYGYTDGTFRDSRTTSGNVSTVTNTFRLGGHQGGTAVASLFWQGLIDEARVINAAQSANWITTEYNNQSSPATFYSVDGLATNVTVTPTALVSTFSVPAYAVLHNALVTPSAQVGTFSIPAYAINLGVSVSTLAQVATFSIPTYFVEAGDAIVSPDALGLTFSIPTYDVKTYALVMPDGQVLTFDIPEYTIVVEANIIITPDTLVLTFVTPDRTKVGGVWDRTLRNSSGDWTRSARNVDDWAKSSRNST